MRLPVGLVAMAAYFVVSRAVLNLYPFSTFEMYSTERVSSGSRIIALDARGAARELDAYASFSCSNAIDVSYRACESEWPFYYVPYLDQRAAEYVAAHGGPGGEPVRIVRRIYRLTDADHGAPPFHDCALTACTAEVR